MKTIRLLILILSFLITIFDAECQHEWDAINHIENDILSSGSDSMTIRLKNLAYSDRLTLPGSSKYISIKNGDLITVIREQDTVKVYEGSDTLKTGDTMLDLLLVRVNSKFVVNLINSGGVTKEISSKQGIRTTLYYDALLLRNGATTDEKRIIKEKYAIKTPNIFLADTLASIRVGTFQGSKSLASGFISGIGGLDISKYADGLAKFMVKRVKQELNNAFFKNFRETLYDSTNQDLRILFPSTTFVLGTIGENIYDYEKYLLTLREGFENDYKTIPDHLPKFIKANPQYFDNDKESKVVLLLGSEIASGLMDHEHPGKIIADIRTEEYKNDLPEHIIWPFLMIQELSEAFREMNFAGQNDYWVDRTKVNNLLKDEIFLKLFAGLYIESIRKKDTLISEKLLSNSKLVMELIPLISEFTLHASRINNIINGANNSNDIPLDIINSYIDAVTEVFYSMNTAYQLIYDKSEDKKMTRFLSYIKNSNSLVSNLSRERYNSALFNLIELYKLSGRSDDKRLNWLFLYGGFMASVLSAEDAADIEKMLEVYSLPAGSSSVKRNSYFNIALNSYCGLMFGFDMDVETPVVGINAPVGIAFSWACNKGSFSIFPSIIDLGALTTYRFNYFEAETPKIYLREIISPGLFLSYGIEGYPISFNLGAQAAPLLSRIDGELLFERPLRFSLSVAVDIPLFNLYNKRDKISK